MLYIELEKIGNEKIIFIIFFSINIGFAQSEKKISTRISLVDEYVVDNYKIPSSILFYSSGHSELEKFYNILFKKLKKEFKNNQNIINFEFEENVKISSHIKSYDELNSNFKNDNYDAICVFGMNNFGFEYPNGYVDAVVIVRVDFFMMLIEPKTQRVLMKRRYNIGARENFYNENRKLAKDIAKEIKS